jgi:hypothetical protein
MGMAISEKQHPRRFPRLVPLVLVFMALATACEPTCPWSDMKWGGAVIKDEVCIGFHDWVSRERVEELAGASGTTSFQSVPSSSAYLLVLPAGMPLNDVLCFFYGRPEVDYVFPNFRLSPSF